MASVISHPAVPLALAVALGPSRIPPALTVAACAASILPDIDALGYAAGVPYDHVLGHRGFTHSLFFASVVALLGALFARRLGAAPATTFAVIFVAAASHGLLDSMTTGGLGVAVGAGGRFATGAENFLDEGPDRDSRAVFVNRRSVAPRTLGGSRFIHRSEGMP
jgi:membrane-bound metal-dependent hydrolase YbcI (DUF457 family)